MKLTSNNIGRVQLEISNYCNAKCSLCERESREHLNNSYLSIDIIKSRFTKGFDNLRDVMLCGNVDEPTTNPDILDIIRFFKDKQCNVSIATNGGARDESFWEELGTLDIKVVFGIDGLEDTNHLYRKNVKWKKLERNFKAYINAGGVATWQFIPFEWNTHELTQARQRAFEYGFKEFFIQENDRV